MIVGAVAGVLLLVLVVVLVVALSGDDRTAAGTTTTPAPATAPTAGATLTASSTTARPIPDDVDEGIVDPLTLTGAGTVASVQVSVDITHPCTTDVEVTVRSPAGSEAKLTPDAGFGCDRGAGDLALRLDSREGGPLVALVGQTAAGTWQLEVADPIIRDTGTLDRWSITVQTR